MLHKISFILGFLTIHFATIHASSYTFKTIKTFEEVNPDSEYGIAIDTDELQLYINGKPYEKWSYLLPDSVSSYLWYYPIPQKDPIIPEPYAYHSKNTKITQNTFRHDAREFYMIKNDKTIKIVEHRTTTITTHNE